VTTGSIAYPPTAGNPATGCCLPGRSGGLVLVGPAGIAFGLRRMLEREVQHFQQSQVDGQGGRTTPSTSGSCTREPTLRTSPALCSPLCAPAPLRFSASYLSQMATGIAISFSVERPFLERCVHSRGGAIAWRNLLSYRDQALRELGAKSLRRPRPTSSNARASTKSARAGTTTAAHCSNRMYVRAPATSPPNSGV
jgi:hypothetical protein